MYTISQETLNRISKAVGESDIRRNEPMKEHTTMKVGGPAAWFFTPRDEEGIRVIAEEFRNTEHCGDDTDAGTGTEHFYVLGHGSNVIVRDEGYDGVILCLDNYAGFRILGEDNDSVLVCVKAGTDNKDFSDAMIREGLSGFEFASGIPGSVGGATAMNAGAYDGEIRQIVREVRLLDHSNRVIVKTAEEMDFGYRHSLASDGSCIILETTFALKRRDPVMIAQRVAELTKQRQDKQPLEYPSCGSTFKRPEGYFAGKLITDAGLKGFCLGGAQVSDKHAGFIINKDHAAAADVLALIRHVQDEVLKSQGVALECEVKIL